MGRLILPNFEFKELTWIQQDNVSSQGRSIEYEKQNEYYKRIGFTVDNTTYYQCFEVGGDIHDFCKTIFPRYSVSVFKQPSGSTLPVHEDTFYKFAETQNIDPYECCRVNVFLEDWSSGHYFEINGNPVLQWKQGDSIIIKRDEPHLSGNMGVVPKYTMQITGVYNELTGC